MKNSYDESLVDESDYDDDTLFAKYVMKDDHDLFTIDKLLRDLFVYNEKPD